MNGNDYKLQAIKYGRDINLQNLSLDEGEFAWNLDTGTLYGGGLDGNIFIINPTQADIESLEQSIQDKIGKDGGTINGILVVKQGIETNSIKSDKVVLGDYQVYINNESDSMNHILNYAAYILRQGKKLYIDEEFNYGTNNVKIYNTANGSNSVKLSLTQDLVAPNSTRNILRIETTDIEHVAPYLGGIHQNIDYDYSHSYVTIFKAKLPVGFEFGITENELGIGGSAYFISSNKGTGKYENYIVMWSCGTHGAISNGGYIYVKGNKAVAWDIASITAFDITNLNEASEENKNFIFRETYLEFPNIGNSEKLYVDTTNNKTYRWDSKNLKYFCIGSDYNEIEIIYGGSASN